VYVSLLAVGSPVWCQTGPERPPNPFGAMGATPLPTLPVLPRISPPPFDDPLQKDDRRRFLSLWQEFARSDDGKLAAQANPSDCRSTMIEFTKKRAEERQRLYGETDERTIAAIEDVGITISIFPNVAPPDFSISLSPKAAAPDFLNRAVELRAHEGAKSVAYWKDLQRQCDHGVMQFKPCESALEIRAGQPDASALELATRASFAGWLESTQEHRQKELEYRSRALTSYERIPGISPAFLAAEYRYLTGMAVAYGVQAEAARLNELTNKYLMQADGNSGRAVPTSSLASYPQLPSGSPLFEAATGQMAVTQDMRATSKSADQLLDEFLLGVRGAIPGQPFPADAQDFFLFGLSSGRSNACQSLDSTSGVGSLESLVAILKGQTIEANFLFSSASSLAYASAFQWICGGDQQDSADARQTLPSPPIPAPDGIPGYGTMVRWKGMFSELIAQREQTILPGYGNDRTDAIRGMDLNSGKFQQTIIDAARDAAQKAAQRAAQNRSLPNAPSPTGDTTQYLNAMMQQFGETIRAVMDGITAPIKRAQATGNGDPLGFRLLLNAHEAFVDMVKYRVREGDRFGGYAYFAVVSDASGSKLVPLGAAEPIDRAVSDLMTAFGGGDGRGRGADIRGIRTPNTLDDVRNAAWQAVEDRVVRKLLGSVPNGTTALSISPDSSLSLVPYTAMMFDMGSDASVAVVPSVYDFVRIRQARKSSGQGAAVLVGDLDYGAGSERFGKLAGTAREIASVTRLAAAAGVQTVKLSGTQATRAAVLAQTRGAQFVHLATHGFWSSGSSQTASDAFGSAGLALSLANSGSPESILRASDVLQLDLSNARLVTLSACVSGQGRPVDGQGLMGFETALMASGAQSLLLSLWPVPDQATSVLMEKFYAALWSDPSTTSFARALRQAQDAMRRDPNFSDPRNWAAWTLVGDSR